MKHHFRSFAFMSLAAVFAASICLAACSDGSSEDPVLCTDIEFKASGYDEGETLYLNLGESVTVQATVLPNDTTDKTLTWETSNADIGIEPRDDTRAVITAYDLGSATITATCGEFSKSIEVECVASVAPESLSVLQPSMTVPVTQRAQIEYSFQPENTSNQAVNFSVTAIGEADASAVSVVEENGSYYIAVSQLAVVGDQFVITLRSAADPTISATVNLTVGALDVESMSFKQEEMTLSVNDPAYRLLPVFEPEETSYREVEFVSSDPDICDVDEIGTLIPKQAGEVTITATNLHDTQVTCTTTVTVTTAESEYLMRLLKKSDVDALEAVSYEIMDFETDKVAFNAWRKVVSEDSNSASHISDAGWAIWMVGFDTYDDDDGAEGGLANTLTYCKMAVPAEATQMQFVFRAHPLPDDEAKFKIMAITDDYQIIDCTSGWVTMSNSADMFYNIDVTDFAGDTVTFVVMQDQISNKPAGSYMKVSLMYRRCLFNVGEEALERWIEDESYSIAAQQQQ